VNKRYLETIRVEDGKIRHLSYHQQRVNTTLCNEKIISLQEILSPPQKGLYRCRVVYDAHSFAVSYHSYEKRSIKKLKLVYDDTISYDKKYEDRRSIDKLFATKGACDDILIVKNGFITDTSIANIALKQGDTWFTPISPLLQGTTRQRLLDTNQLRTRQIRPEELGEYSAVALMNAMIDFDIIAHDNIRKIIC
jgi:4-amino-4-deoxychorismate lyase